MLRRIVGCQQHAKTMKQENWPYPWRCQDEQTSSGNRGARNVE
jgi:hypothetical protein